jgi:lipoprotein-anchoring transpeptidase ErfK/SrfK
MSSHRRAVRPRYGRIAALATSVTVSAVAALAGMGFLATSSAQAGATARTASYTQHTGGSAEAPSDQQPESPTTTTSSSPPDYVVSSNGTSTSADATLGNALPVSSGTGRRIVFSQTEQRIWLVGGQADHVRRTYLVSGSVTDNLQPGTYSVYSKSRWAVGIEDTGVMQYFVRFTQGPTGAAIGFHSIPTHYDVPLQSKDQLGTPQSHGCIRQDLPDAIALWNFAPVGAKVVVVA